jgi:hypothetical protein
MSMATRTDTQSPALHVAESHDLIRVQGARCPSLFTQVPRKLNSEKIAVARAPNYSLESAWRGVA